MKTKLREPYKRFFGTLANQYRLDVIEILKEKPRTVMGIAKKLKYHQSTVSHNLRRLEECGFVFVKPNGRERIYSLNRETIKPLLILMHSHMDNYCSKVCEEHGTNRKRNAL
ncbi:MAG: metalloregulator ArsR/SmtB family transcription factor [Candidatus Nanoarchaeia archaeon]